MVMADPSDLGLGKKEKEKYVNYNDEDNCDNNEDEICDI